MWKIVVGFILFAALSLFFIYKAGDKVDMSGETHSGDIAHPPVRATPAASAPAVSPAADPASAPK